MTITNQGHLLTKNIYLLAIKRKEIQRLSVPRDGIVTVSAHELSVMMSHDVVTSFHSRAWEPLSCRFALFHHFTWLSLVRKHYILNVVGPSFNTKLYKKDNSF